MPRQARLDVPGTLHHIIIRGRPDRKIFTDRIDRQQFLTRLSDVALETSTSIYAWALLPNHAHMLLRSGGEGVSSFMRRLLTSYAIIFNRRHKCSGHLFQDRYKSILCQEEAFFPELVRFIHLLPVHEKAVRSIHALEKYPWCGHRSIINGEGGSWQDCASVLMLFGKRNAQAVKAYRAFVNSGLKEESGVDLGGGGLIRSAGGWPAVRALRQAKARIASDSRILGEGTFVSRILKEAKKKRSCPVLDEKARRKIERIVRQACRKFEVAVHDIQSGSRKGAIPRIRLAITQQLLKEGGFTLTEIARHLGVSSSALSKSLSRIRKA
ncbi:MAG TPA: transposase [Thermodesulfobacteriota bacterium]|nr:transposase [Deltaproteobacteria bacterium]HNR13550.1 transposase [Thermodesulfobacteriota bacterium]HNU73083.1 transposase [Thermodesulfobacteriota bacterium]HOC38784.1 transposase [Thermodesulfobacteriota bacterium]HQO77339.1 transposase [Thermodesulfobacteriota bacterium]